MIQEYDFDRKLELSYGVVEHLQTDLLLSYFPGARQVEPRDNLQQDKNGIDLWVCLNNGRKLAVDMKVREKDFGKDDLALETWSVIEKEKIGWTLDENKHTDYIVWFWKDTKKYCVVPFLPLLKAFRAKHREWKLAYKSALQRSNWNGTQWHSECIFVPRREVWGAIFRMANGVLTP